MEKTSINYKVKVEENVKAKKRLRLRLRENLGSVYCWKVY